MNQSKYSFEPSKATEPFVQSKFKELETVDEALLFLQEQGLLQEVTERILGASLDTNCSTRNETVCEALLYVMTTSAPALTTAAILHACGDYKYGALSLRDMNSEYGVSHQTVKNIADKAVRDLKLVDMRKQKGNQ